MVKPGDNFMHGGCRKQEVSGICGAWDGDRGFDVNNRGDRFEDSYGCDSVFDWSRVRGGLGQILWLDTRRKRDRRYKGCVTRERRARKFKIKTRERPRLKNLFRSER